MTSFLSSAFVFSSKYAMQTYQGLRIPEKLGALGAVKIRGCLLFLFLRELLKMFKFKSMLQVLVCSLGAFCLSTKIQALPQRYQVVVKTPVKNFTFTQDNPNQEVPKIVDFTGFLNGKDVILLHFWSIACPSCRRELPEIDRFAASLAGKPVKVIVISVDDPKSSDVYHYFIKQRILHLTPYHRPSFGYPKIRGLPTTFFIDPNGDIVGKIEGTENWEDPALLRLVDRLSETPPRPLEKTLWQKIRDWIGI